MYKRQLFYRLGDFYEMFFDDALTVSKELEITLTGKECGLPERAPMCGVPFHAVDSYLNRLVQKEMCIRDRRGRWRQYWPGGWVLTVGEGLSGARTGYLPGSIMRSTLSP